MNETNWSDFENLLINLCGSMGDKWKSLDEDLFEIQKLFSSFLDDIIKPELLATIGKMAQSSQTAIESLSKLFVDLSEDDYLNFKFPSLTDHYHLFNFIFVNFNYTYLFDNLIYLDKAQFNPRPHFIADRNFSFYPNPNGFISNGHMSNSNTVFSSYIVSKIVHPHGNQSVAKSILFGFNDESQVKKSNGLESRRFAKTYWVQNDLYYKQTVNDTNLFIIFGMSCGVTDKWWWQEIIMALDKDMSELIIYHYTANTQEDKEAIVDNFIQVSGVDFSSNKVLEIKKKIFVILHNETTDRKIFRLKP